jgi:predicted dehydrogenase
LGLGWIGRHRLAAIAETGAAKIAVLADANAGAVSEALQLVPDAASATSLDELLAAELDALVIATPSAQHAEQARAALERGCAVFCQKPLGRTAAETRKVVAAGAQADRYLGVDLSYRYIPGMMSIRDLIAAGELGDIFAINLVFHNAYGPDKPWFYDRRLSGGGCLLDLGIHLIDLALWSLGWPVVHSTQGRLFRHGRPLRAGADEVEDYAVASLDVQSGPTIQLACSWHLPAGRDAVIEASFYGTRGGASLTNVNGSFYHFEARRFRGTTSEPLSHADDRWFGQAAVAWLARLVDNRYFDPDAHHLVEVAEVLDDIYASAERSSI